MAEKKLGFPRTTALRPEFGEKSRRELTAREKAAVIVRLMLAEGGSLPINTLPEHMQAALAEQMSQMRLIDRNTLDRVVKEFLDQLEQVGLSFPGGIEGALSIMDGHISTTAASRLRRLAGATSNLDPWDRLMALPLDDFLPILELESIEVAAVILSKFPVSKAAELLGRMPGDRARRVAYAVSMTGNVDPETVRRIGLALAAQVDSAPPKAFDSGPVERVGAILNIAAALTRDDVLLGLDEADKGFADLVRKAIFTFVHIPTRLSPRDVPKLLRLVEAPVLVTALTAAQSSPALTDAVEHILANITQRMAQSLRDEIASRGKVTDKDGEAAMGRVVLVIRELEASGDLVLMTPEE